MLFFYLAFECLLLYMFIHLAVQVKTSRTTYALNMLVLYTVIGSTLLLLGLTVVYSFTGMGTVKLTAATLDCTCKHYNSADECYCGMADCSWWIPYIHCMCTYMYRGVPLGALYITPPCVYLEWLPALIVLPEPQVSLRKATYNYFYELVIMTYNHDIAYLMRVCSQAPPLGTPVRPPRGYSNTQHAAQVRAQQYSNMLSSWSCSRKTGNTNHNLFTANTWTRMPNHVTLAVATHTKRPLSPYTKYISVNVNMCF